MTDIYDRASDLELAERERHIAAQRALATVPAVHYSHCMDCGEEIEQARYRAVRNCRRCADCEAIEEKIQQFYSR